MDTGQSDASVNQIHPLKTLANRVPPTKRRKPNMFHDRRPLAVGIPSSKYSSKSRSTIERPANQVSRQQETLANQVAHQKTSAYQVAGGVCVVESVGGRTLADET